MKKYLFAAGALAIAALLPTQRANAEMTLGVEGGYSGYNEGGYASVFFQYDIIKHVRVAPQIGYAFRNQGASAFLLDVDVQFPFRVARAFSLYPLVGFTYNNWSYSGWDAHASRAGANFGGGMELYLTRQFKINVNAKYSLMNDTSGVFVGFGLGYIF